MGLVEDIALLEEAHKENEDRNEYEKRINRMVLGAAVISLPMGLAISYIVDKYDPMFNLISHLSNYLAR
ncbi:MAG TPA: hypothetical protein VJH92_01220 [Candidatus Nanoarchaeia archaeon]|nr:hypothetical protein [Candidatus Nanoarchaeia archaeon]